MLSHSTSTAATLGFSLTGSEPIHRHTEANAGILCSLLAQDRWEEKARKKLKRTAKEGKITFNMPSFSFFFPPLIFWVCSLVNMKIRLHKPFFWLDMGDLGVFHCKVWCCVTKHSLCCQKELKLQPRSMHKRTFECSHWVHLIKKKISSHLPKKTYQLKGLKAC